MAQQTSELAFEKELCHHLETHGWLYSPDDTGYDPVRALYPDDVFAWLEETQPGELAKRVKPDASPEAQAKARVQVLDRLAALLDKGDPVGGTLQVLRGGFKDMAASFRMLERRPEADLNADRNARYAANRLRVMRQVHYSVKTPAKSLDIVLFVNGIPVATVELKTNFTQNVDDAKRQYQDDRDPTGEPLLGFGTRALVHFAVSNDEVWMTTRLAGKDTRFLPFNRGHDGAAGNGPDPDWSSPIAYLWRDVWQRDAWLDILGKFIHYEREGTKSTLIFSRFHQWDAVTRLVGDARTHGPGRRYLVQHSAGSGKTNSIAW
ncbi:MAG: type I restriction endonuclease subunit R, partial [Planctomycetales bacterium]|nr:type I restriction endonuclease subunit R [Planctomycetales bacterium]